MDFSLNQSENHNPLSIFKEDINKYDEIKHKLCAKRELLEKLIRESEDVKIREENTIELVRLKDSMNILGITEIDYQVYKEKKEKDLTEAPPSLFS